MTNCPAASRQIRDSRPRAATGRESDHSPRFAQSLGGAVTGTHRKDARPRAFPVNRNDGDFPGMANFGTGCVVRRIQDVGRQIVQTGIQRGVGVKSKYMILK
ncbi:hypothetical protein B0G77_0491 [Paraburkholderia sp. BL10I2N1]|nr:hypothetical protein B0G77_0491 [Paraburkholderia sp. BL10I2N1]